MYGKLPNKKDLLQNKLKERKYFDSGDYAMSKAGKADTTLDGGLGREHPSPQSIPHLTPQNSNNGHLPSMAGSAPGLQPTLSHGASGSPVKESSILQRGMSIDDTDDVPELPAADEPEGIPIQK